MPSRRTKRGAQRTPIGGDYDAIICGASFAGLVAARELAGARRPDGSPARVLMLDRYEVGERQTSACATTTNWLEALDLTGSELQRFDQLIVHAKRRTVPIDLPFTFSTFDYELLCATLAGQGEAQFETATVTGRAGFGEPHDGLSITVTTDRGNVSAPLVLDALGWRRVLGKGTIQPPRATLSRGLEVHPHGSSDHMEIFIDRVLVPEGYGWSFPADHEVRVGIGSFDPEYHVRKPTVELAQRLERVTDGYQGNWIPHKLRDATEGGVFFAGDSAGHCLPLTAEGIRTAFYFGIAAAREMRRVIEGRATRATALRRYARFSERNRREFELLLVGQRRIPQIPIRVLETAIGISSRPRISNWAFARYLNVAHPSYVSQVRTTNTVPAISSATPSTRPVETGFLASPSSPN